jgi:hypothetical protein
MHEARLLRFGAGKAHLGATFHALRLLVETLGFVLWHTPEPRHWVLGHGSTIGMFRQASGTCSSQVGHPSAASITSRKACETHPVTPLSDLP